MTERFRPAGSRCGHPAPDLLDVRVLFGCPFNSPVNFKC